MCDGFFRQQSASSLDAVFAEILRKTLLRIQIPALRDAARRSLTQFYMRLRLTAGNIPVGSLFVYLALAKTAKKSHSADLGVAEEFLSAVNNREAQAILDRCEESGEEVILPGVPLQTYAQTYFRDKIAPVLDRMAKEEALDPDSEAYLGRMNTLRNRAEREVRYQSHIDEIQDFRARGVRLVVISAHADCSERCRPFQGEVFSLDGTSGTTSDGRSFAPLETATDIWTKNGKWKNGLFGFNCRHYMVAYQPGASFPKVSAQTERRQYAINIRQRAMESQVRRWKIERDTYRGINRARYLNAKKRAAMAQDRLERFCAENGRAIEPTRTKIAPR